MPSVGHANAVCSLYHCFSLLTVRLGKSQAEHNESASPPPTADMKRTCWIDRSGPGGDVAPSRSRDQSQGLTEIDAPKASLFCALRLARLGRACEAETRLGAPHGLAPQHRG